MTDTQDNTRNTVWLLTVITLFVLGTYSLIVKVVENHSRALQKMGTEKKRTQPSDAPKQKDENDDVTINNAYYGELNGEAFIKLEFTPYKEDVQYTWHWTAKPQPFVILSQELSVVDNVNNADIDWEPVVSSSITYKSLRGGKYVIDDRLLSFKKVPNSNNVLFVMDWSGYSQLQDDLPNNTKARRILYLYNTKSKITKVIKEFVSSNHEASYPLIRTVSPDNRYAEINLYYCMNCGGHTPQTLLVDLNTLQIKTVGRVSYFMLRTGGEYEYKVYAVYDCITPVVEGVCSIPPEHLPLQYGSFNSD